MVNKKSIAITTVSEKVKGLSEKESQPESTKIQLPASWYGTRHTQLLLMFFMTVIAYGMRVSLSVGIVAMTDPKSNPDHNFPIYDWDDKSVVLSSFFWGYVIPQIGAGQLARTFGSKWLLTASIGVNSVFSLLIPIMADQGSWGVMICRVVQGFFQGFMFPCVHCLLSRWVPLSERSRMGTFVYAGGPFGTVISMPLTGWISASAWGWPAVFYLYGAMGAVWVVIWLILGAEKPSSSKYISKEEREYIEASIGESCNQKELPTPWKDIVKSLPVWAVLVAHCGQNWGFWTLLTEIPSYMSHVLNHNIKDNGLLSATPYFTLWVLSFFFSALADVMINKKLFSIGTTRKINNTIGLVIPAFALIGLSFVDKDESEAALALLIIAVGMNSAVYCGFQLNHIDLAPSHASTLMGITNSISNICSIIAPLLVQFIVTDEKDPEQWKMVFFVAAGIYILTNFFYVLYGTGELQYWNGPLDSGAPPSEVLNERSIGFCAVLFYLTSSLELILDGFLCVLITEGYHKGFLQNAPTILLSTIPMKFLTNRMRTLALKEVGALFAQPLPISGEKGNSFSNSIVMSPSGIDRKLRTVNL